MRNSRFLLLLTGLLAASAANAGPYDTFRLPTAPVKPQTIPSARALTPALAHAKTIQVTETEWYSVYTDEKPGPLQPGVNYSVKVVLPNKVWIQAHPVTRKGAKLIIGHPVPASLYVCNGKTKYEYNRHTNQFIKTATTDALWGYPLISKWDFTDATFLLFTPSPFALSASGKPLYQSFHQASKTTLNGKAMTLWTMKSKNFLGDIYLQKIWIDLSTDLPVQQSTFSREGNRFVETHRYEYSDWVLDKPIPPALFAWTPPATAKESVLAPETARPPLLAIGTQAPDFTVQDKDGKPVKLSDFAGKVVVLDFWATWCGPCQFALKHLASIAKENAEGNVVFLCVNVWDTKEKFAAWLPKHPDYDALRFLIDTTGFGKDTAAKYQVFGIPTTYLIDKHGKIIGVNLLPGTEEMKRKLNAVLSGT